MKKSSVIFSHVGLILMTAVMFFPLYAVFVMGTYYSEDIFRGLPVWPSDYVLENLRVVFRNNFGTAYLNSFVVSASSVILSVLVSSMVGFAIAKYDFKLKKFMIGFIMLIMMIPTQISIIGYVREMKSFGTLNSLLPLVFVWVAHPFGAFFMMQFIRDSVPSEVLESARLDGCTEPGIFFRIVMPFIKPGIVTLSTLVFL